MYSILTPFVEQIYTHTRVTSNDHICTVLYVHTKQSLALEVEGGPQVHLLPQVHNGVSDHLNSKSLSIIGISGSSLTTC